MTNPSPQASATFGSFNTAPVQDAERTVLSCCASRTFATAMAGGRPYPDPASLLAAVDAAFTTLNWDDIVEAMSEHPRIGDRAVRGGMSAAEQSGAAAAPDCSAADIPVRTARSPIRGCSLMASTISSQFKASNAASTAASSAAGSR